MAEKGVQVAAAMHDAQDKRILVFHAVHYDVFPHGQAAVSGAEIFRPRTSDIGEACEGIEAVGDGVYQAVGNLDAAAFLRDV
jgi:hypothetical protein